MTRSAIASRERRGTALAGMLILLVVLSGAVLASVGAWRDGSAIDVSRANDLRLRYAGEAGAALATRMLADDETLESTPISVGAANAVIVSATATTGTQDVVIETSVGYATRRETFTVAP